MSLKILEEKEAIREVIDRFSNLECDVPAQQALFTKDAHIMVHMGGILAMDIHGSEEMRNQFEGFTKTVKASGMIQQERQNNIINILGGHSYAM